MQPINWQFTSQNESYHLFEVCTFTLTDFQISDTLRLTHANRILVTMMEMPEQKFKIYGYTVMFIQLFYKDDLPVRSLRQ